MGLALLLDAKRIATLSLVALVIAYVGILLHPFAEAFLHRRALVKGIRHPFGILLKNAADTGAVDLRYFPRLSARSLNLLEFAHLEVRAEREYFERRVSLVVGAIDKLGVAPGLLAAFLSLHQLRGIGFEWWVLSLAYATPVLYLFAVMAHYLLMRLDRMVRLLELVITHKKDSGDCR